MLEEVARALRIDRVHVQSAHMRVEKAVPLYPGLELVSPRDEVMAIGCVSSQK